MTARVVTVRAVGKQDIEASGPAVFTALAELGIPKMRPRVKSGNVWLFPANRLEDLYAWCDHHSVIVTVTL